MLFSASAAQISHRQRNLVKARGRAGELEGDGLAAPVPVSTLTVGTDF
jgi:hypothetical protein